MSRAPAWYPLLLALAANLVLGGIGAIALEGWLERGMDPDEYDAWADAGPGALLLGGGVLSTLAGIALAWTLAYLRCLEASRGSLGSEVLRSLVLASVPALAAVFLLARYLFASAERLRLDMLLVPSELAMAGGIGVGWFLAALWWRTGFAREE